MHGGGFYSLYDKKSTIARLLHLRYQVFECAGDPRFSALPVAQWTAAEVGAMIAAIEPDAAKLNVFAYDSLSERRKRACRLEHRRWNAYMRSEGYVYPGRPDDAELKARIGQRDWQKCHLAKTHSCIVPWEDDSGASELERYSAMGADGSGYRDYDDIVQELIKVRSALLAVTDKE